MGREFVEAYAIFVHYVKGLYDMASTEGAHHTEAATIETGTTHQH